MSVGCLLEACLLSVCTCHSRQACPGFSLSERSWPIGVNLGARTLTANLCFVPTEQHVAGHPRSSFLSFLLELLKPDAVSLFDLPRTQ